MIRRPTPHGGSTSSNAPCSRPTLHPARSPRTRFPGWPASLPSSTTSASCLATENGLYVRDIADGRLTLHVALEADNAGHPFQRWAGPRQRRALDRDHGPQGRKGRGRDLSFWRRRTAQALCRHLASRMRSAFRPMAPRPISPTPAKASFIAFAIDPANGLPTSDPAPLFDHRGGVGGLDGAVVDAEGLIWNARWGGSCIDAYSPEGQRVRTIRVPARQPSCPVFVGSEFRPAAGHHRLAGHGRAGQGGRSAPWPNLHSRRRRTGAAGTSHQARPAMTDRSHIAHEVFMRLAEPQPVIDHPFPSAGMVTDDAPVLPAPTANRDNAATKAQNSGSVT